MGFYGLSYDICSQEWKRSVNFVICKVVSISVFLFLAVPILYKTGPVSLTIDHDSSVGVQTLSGDVAAILTGQEDKTCCNLTRLAGSPDWHGMELFHGGTLHRRRNQWCPDCLVSVEQRRGLGGNLLGPGHTQFTRMPFLTCWFDRARVNATIAPLVAV